MRRELPADFKRDLERQQMKMKRARSALHRAALELASIEGQSGHPGVDAEIETATTSIAKMLAMIE